MTLSSATTPRSSCRTGTRSLPPCPTLHLRYPDTLFDTGLELRGRDRRVELVATERAHADGDTFLVIPDAGVVFCGDLLFVGCHPYLADGDVTGLRAALAALEASGAGRFVPGHGVVGGVGELHALSQYVDDIEQLSRERRTDAAMPDAYRSWAFARFLAPNLEFCAGGGRQADPAPGEASG